MSRFTQRGQGSPLSFLKTSTDTSLATLVGAKFEMSDGREFVLVQNGGTALASGRLVQGPAKIGANHTNLALSTAAIGAIQITATLGATAVTANQYAGGYLVINAGTGIGQTLKIQSHPAAEGSATVVLTLEDPLSVATASASSKGTLELNPYGSSNGATVATSGVVVCPTTLTGPVIGVTVYPIAASSTTVPTYGFIQTRGVVGCLNDATTAIGLAVMTYVAATSSRVGTAYVAGVTTEVRPIMLQL
jgi:hypothetical protein